jgi:hypothetical protein
MFWMWDVDVVGMWWEEGIEKGRASLLSSIGRGLLHSLDYSSGYISHVCIIYEATCLGYSRGRTLQNE